MSNPAASQQPQLTPAHIFEVLNAYQQSEALSTALDLGLFTAVAEGARTVSELASKCQSSERGIRILSDYLTILGFLTKSPDGYGLSPESALFLDRNSRAYVGNVKDFLHNPALKRTFENLPEIVRTGRTTLPGEGTVEGENPVWVSFARNMASLSIPTGQFLASLVDAHLQGPIKILDLAAGHGMYGIITAQRNPEAEIYPLDWESVLQVARENAERCGVSARLHPLLGNAFNVEFGTGYDAVFVTNFFHHFDQETCEKLMAKVQASLKPGGFCFTLDFVPNDDRVSPPGPAAFSLMMLGTTASGDAYTFSQYDQMFRGAGFAENKHHEIPGMPMSVIVSKK
jgi:ubiquinone/menaquinone biosynthesis C-methylase UbiE